MYLIKEENNIKNKKIQAQEIMIQENQKSYLDLKNELDILILENKNLKERIGLLEAKEEELKTLNKSFSEYESQKIKEIQDLENKIKEYEIELNQIKNEKNKKREYNKIKEIKIDKSEIPLEKNIVNKNEINNKF